MGARVAGAGQDEVRVAEALLPERVLGIPESDVDVGCAEGDLGRRGDAPKARDRALRRDGDRLRRLLAANLDGAIAVGLDEGFADDRAIHAILRPDFQAGEQHQNDDNKAHDRTGLKTWASRGLFSRIDCGKRDEEMVA